MLKTPFALLTMSLLALSMGLFGCQKDEIEIPIYSTVAGDFVGVEKCPTVPGDPYTVTITNQADVNSGKVFITNLYNIGGTYAATLSGNTVTVPTTPYSYTISGITYKGNISATGTIQGNILTISYKLDGDDVQQCSFSGDREFRGPTHQGPN